MPLVTLVMPTDTSVVSITAADGIQSLSFQCDPAGGSCGLNGDSSFQGIESSVQTFTDGESFTTTSFGSSAPLSGITLSYISGTVKVTMQK